MINLTIHDKNGKKGQNENKTLILTSDIDFAHFLESGTKMEISPQIKPPLHVNPKSKI